MLIQPEGAGFSLNGLRVAVTIPPCGWFGGVDYRFALDMADELRCQGATLFELHLGGFIARNEAYIHSSIEALRAFHPDLAVALPNAGYALLCVTTERENLFRDILEIPTILIWDHGVLQFSQLILSSPHGRAGDESGNCIERLRRALDHPLFVHYSPDKGHVAAMHRLGILDAAKVTSFVHFAFPVYARAGRKPSSNGNIGSRLAFAGNVYLERSQNAPFRNRPVLAGIESRMLQAKKTHVTTSFWELLLAEIETQDEDTRRELGLQPDAEFFWRFAHDEIEVVGNTEARLGMLTALRHECDFYGNFVEPQMASTLRDRYGIRMRETLDCISELPSLYRNSELIVDAINAGYISGTSPKVTSCLACGGLILFDYKEDFRQELGDVADLIMYRSIDHLHSLIEQYLDDPNKRRDVSRRLQERVLEKFTFGIFCKQILADQPAWCA